LFGFRSVNKVLLDLQWKEFVVLGLSLFVRSTLCYNIIVFGHMIGLRPVELGLLEGSAQVCSPQTAYGRHGVLFGKLLAFYILLKLFLPQGDKSFAHTLFIEFIFDFVLFALIVYVDLFNPIHKIQVLCEGSWVAVVNIEDDFDFVSVAH